MQFTPEIEDETTPMSGGADAPPFADRPPLSKPDLQLVKDLAGLYATAGMTIAGIGEIKNDPGLQGMGTALITRSESLATGWLHVAKKDPKVMKAIKAITEGSLLSGLVIGHIACILPLLVDRGVFPAEFAMAVAAVT